MTSAPMPPVRGLIFDKDGTLFDFNATWGGWMAKTIAGLSAGDADRASAMAEVLGFDLASGLYKPGALGVAATTGEIVDLLLPHLPGETTHEALLARLDAAASAVRQVPVAPLGPLLAELAQGRILALVTNDTEAAARAHLAQVGVTEAFAFLSGFDSGHGGKPAPGQLLAFCAAHGLAPEEVLMIGDSRHDLLAAEAAGMRGIGVLTGPAGPEELAPLAEAVLPSIAALPGWLSGL
ncbi:HAD family hydrolase [Pseudoroseicyclus sp. CXY001]|uniref:HAD family hydrolase n=1 Tax=Pseudoroseicyclus sp. CXY001 TaxID=3242492 RepID=UPI003571049B